MYSKNDKISLRQLKRLLIFDFFGVLSLITPYVISSNAGYDGLGAFLFASALLLIYLLLLVFYLKQMDEPYLDFTKKNIGTFFAVIFCILYLIKFFFTTVISVKLIVAVVNTTILTDYSSLSIALPFILVAGYIAYKGIEVRARYAEVLYFIIFIPIVGLLLFTCKDIDLANLTPFFAKNGVNILNAGFLFFLLFNQLELLLFVKPFVKPKKPKASLATGMFSYSLQGLIFVVLVSVLIFALTVGLLGDKASARSLWSTVSIMQLAHLPWTLLNRQDSILIAFWLLTSFSAISGLFYYMSHVMKHMFCCKSRNTLLPLIMLLVFLVVVVPADLNRYYEWYMTYMTYIGLPQSILLPVIPIIVKRLTPGRKKTVKKATGISLLFLITIGGLCSCANQVEVEDRDFVQVLGIDYNNDFFQVYYAMPDLSAVSEQPSEDKENLLKNFISADLYNVEEQYRMCSEKKLDYRHLKAIVIGENLANNKNAFQEFIRYCENHYEISQNTDVYFTSNTVWQVMNMNSKLSDGLGDFLNLLNQNYRNGSKDEVTLEKLINDKNNTDKSIQVPILSLQQNGLMISGEAIVINSKLKISLDQEASIYADLLRGNGENNRLFLENPLDIGNDTLVVTMNKVDAIKSLTLKNGSPYLHILLQGRGQIEQGIEEVLEYTTNRRLEVYSFLEKSIDQQIQQRLMEQLTQIVSTERIDYLNTFRMSRYQNRDIYMHYQDYQTGFLRDLQIEVTVDFTINQY